MAVLLGDKFNGFFSIIGSFPTVIFSVLCLVCAIYWLIAMLGVIDIDILDMPDADASTGNNGLVNGAAAVLVKFGLNGVPFLIIVSLVSLFGWLISFYSIYFLPLSHLPVFISWIIDIAIFASALYLSLWFTAWAIRPLRRFFLTVDTSEKQRVIGKLSVVITSRVDSNFGEAMLEDGAAGIQLQVRSYNDQIFNKGDKVIPLELEPESHSYLVISETEFNQKHL